MRDSIIVGSLQNTAILDRLLFKCEVVKLSGKSYPLENRKTIFENEVL